MLEGVLNDDACYAAVRSRDARFDGWFFVCVRTTRIYCRPSCPSVTPRRENVQFAPTAAAAHEMGFRACKRCRPDAAPGSPEWNVRADLVARAMRHIADGVVDREGVSGLARRLGYGERHVHRQLVSEVGAGPIALARAQRAQTARLLIETTDLPMSDVAFAAGFSSIRQFNDTVRAVFAMTPSQVRATAHRRRGGPNGPTGPNGPGSPASRRASASVDRTTAHTLSLRLPFRRPLDAWSLFAFLGERAVPGVEAGTPSSYRRVLSLPHGAAVVEVGTPGADPEFDAQGWIPCVLRLSDLKDLAAAVTRVRRLLDLDADAPAVDAFFAADDALRAAASARHGVRVPGHVDGFELAVRAVLGQQVSVRGARATAARLVQAYGDPLPIADDALTHAFPTPHVIAGVDPLTLPMTRARARTVVALAAAVAAGDVDIGIGADRERTTAALLDIPGIGPWTVAYVRMRALGDPDAFMPTDLGVRRGLEALGLPADPRDAERFADRWRPWRSYATQLLWSVASARSDAVPDKEKSA
jgi:AraC family transcriptional regulator of adaptative response / DNA-3-methyladenine glycosylase II